MAEELEYPYLPGVRVTLPAPIAPRGTRVRAMTYESENNELPAFAVEGVLVPRWVEVWQKWQYDVVQDGSPKPIQVDPDSIEVMDG